MKRLFALISALIFMVCICQTVFADENPQMIKEAYAFSGKLYYCDYPTNRVVLQDVKPLAPTEAASLMAEEAEYLEISVSPGGIWMNDGTKTEVGYLNNFADSDVWVVIAKTADGNLTIPYFSFK